MFREKEKRIVRFFSKNSCTMSGRSIYIFKALADCPAEMMLRWTKSISDRSSDKTVFSKKSAHEEFLWLLKQFGVTVP